MLTIFPFVELKVTRFEKKLIKRRITCYKNTIFYKSYDKLEYNHPKLYLGKLVKKQGIFIICLGTNIYIYLMCQTLKVD